MNKINENIAAKYLRYAENHSKLSSLQKIKISYSICVILGEFEKMSALIVIFLLAGKIKPFLFICITLALTKHYLIGFHAKTVEGCFILSLAANCCIMNLYELISISRFEKYLIYDLGIIIMLLFAPMKSENHLILTKVNKFRGKAVKNKSYIFVVDFAPKREKEKQLQGIS